MTIRKATVLDISALIIMLDSMHKETEVIVPKINSAKKEDSKKKENIPSIAKVCPIIPPVNSENFAQFVPN